MNRIKQWLTERSKAKKLKELKKKWLQNPVVSEWNKKGWMDSPGDNMPFLLSQWEERNEPIPPPHKVKEAMVAEYGKKYNYKVLVETGTYMGVMVNEQKENYNKIISIEIDKPLHEKAIEKFKAFPHIQFYLGDSGKVLHQVVPGLSEPAVFWLDAHYHYKGTTRGEKECPIYEELDAIFNGKDLHHVLLIDDARLFVGKNDYPTIPELTEYVRKKAPSYAVSVKHDIIRFEKK